MSGFRPGMHLRKAGDDKPPTESQIETVGKIAERLGIEKPAKFTRKAYTQFISNHIKRC